MVHLCRMSFLVTRENFFGWELSTLDALDMRFPPKSVIIAARKGEEYYTLDKRLLPIFEVLHDNAL